VHMNLIERYQFNRTSFQLLGRSLSESQGQVNVAATPDWTVADNFAHMAGVADDVLAGRLEGVATDPWTEAQVQARRGRSLSELLEEWESKAPAVEELLMPMADQIDPRLVIDLWTHEQDVRGAIGIAGGDRDSTLTWIVEQLVTGWQQRIEHSELPALQIEILEPTGDLHAQSDYVTSGETVGSLRIDPFEAARLALGRRSRQQILNYEWSGVADTAAYIDLLVVFSPAIQDIIEA
jgi:uncharacterized protein (TIGR03083 family)